MNREICSAFQFSAVRFSLLTRTFNLKVAGSNPARPIELPPICRALRLVSLTSEPARVRMRVKIRLRLVAASLRSLRLVAACSRGFLIPNPRVTQQHGDPPAGPMRRSRKSLGAKKVPRGFKSLPLRSTKRGAARRRLASCKRGFSLTAAPSPRKSAGIPRNSTALHADWRTNGERKANE